MRKILIGILLGVVAGVIDVIPMIVQNLTWDANLSAFAMWVVIGFLISTVEINVKPAIKGIIISFAALLPVAILISWKEPVSLIPITAMTLILGSSLGFSIDRLTQKMK
jgi:hypothetical protein